MPDAEGIKVLVVDDDTSARKLYRRLLEREGYQVGEAENGADALTLVGSFKPRIIVMDAMMPGMDGCDCTRALKWDPATSDIPLIMVSARGETSDVLAGLEAGADEYLTKPIHPKEFLLRVRSVARLVRSRDELLRSNEVRGEQARILSVLLDFSRELAGASSLDEILAETVAVTAMVTCCRRVAVLLPDADGTTLEVAKSTGLDRQTLATLRVPIDDSLAGRVYVSQQPVVINDGDELRAKCADTSSALGGVPMICNILGTDDGVVGVLHISERWESGPFPPSHLAHLDLISSLAAAAIHDCLSRQARDEARDSIVTAMAGMAECRDLETGRHLERVTEFSLLLGEQLKLHPTYGRQITVDYLHDLKRAMPLHDIGKVGVPDGILLKPGRLTPAEWEIMRRHTVLGATTIRTIIARAPGVDYLALAEEVAFGHHEWWDGSGYPRGLREAEIPLSARIAALADVYDALTTRRSYKEAFSHEHATECIVKASGTQFDPAVVEAFLTREAEFRQLAVALGDDPFLETGPSSAPAHVAMQSAATQIGEK
ncbi:MAG: response regulator [Phycisphaerae bacterium]|nr:response regulator [Phycisphaerae bacterium]